MPGYRYETHGPTPLLTVTPRVRVGRVAASLVASLVIVAVGLAGCRGEPTAQPDNWPDSDWKELYDRWQHPQPLPDFQLVDHRGKRFRLHDLGDGHLLVGFIFTRCTIPEACPLTTEKMRQVQQAWRALDPPPPPGRSLQLLSVTLDPAFDTPARLAAYGEARGADLAGTSDPDRAAGRARAAWTFATGPHELVSNALPSLFNILALPDGHGTVSHTVKVALLAPDLTLIAEWKDNAFTADEIIDLIHGGDR